MTTSERLEQLRTRATALGYDIAWAPANQAWVIMDYRPHAPETARLRGVKNTLDAVEAWISQKECISKCPTGEM